MSVGCRHTPSSPMRRIDTHLHYYQADQSGGPIWSNPAMREKLGAAALPAHYHAIGDLAETTKVVVVEARNWASNEWVLQLTEQDDRVLGYVGAIPVEQLPRWKELSRHAKWRGIRINNRDFEAINSSTTLQEHITALARSGQSIDVLARPQTWDAAITLCKNLDAAEHIVINHCVNPRFSSENDKDRERDWKRWLQVAEELADLPNTVCKISGLPSTHDNIQPEEVYQDILSHLLDTFGSERLVWASNWPVCDWTMPLSDQLHLYNSLLGRLSAAEQDAIWYQNAERVYQVTWNTGRESTIKS